MNSQNSIFINNLTVDLIVGIHPQERHTRQQIILDLELFMDLTQAMYSDKLSDTLDYDSFVQQLLLQLADTNFKLLEALAKFILEYCFSFSKIQAVNLKITKPKAIKHTQQLGIQIHRKRHQQ